MLKLFFGMLLMLVVYAGVMTYTCIEAANIWSTLDLIILYTCGLMGFACGCYVLNYLLDEIKKEKGAIS